MAGCIKTGALDREQRLKVFQPVVLHNGVSAIRAHLLNISRTGALAYSVEAADRGTVVRLHLEGTVIPARVLWRDGKRFGLSFVGKISPAILGRMMAAQNELFAKAAVVGADA